MAVYKDVRELLPEDSIVLDDSSFDGSIVGYTDYGNVVYDFDKMVEEYMMDNECSVEDAIDWITYNTMRAIPYFPDPKPIVMYPLEV